MYPAAKKRQKLTDQKLNEAIVDRYYQKHAIRRIAECFEVENQRKALLVMATGTGKTRTAIAISEKLMRAYWVKRILFFADRRALVKQAVTAFCKHFPDVATVNSLENKVGEGRVFVFTYQTMMGLLEERDGGQMRFSPGFLIWLL